MRVVKAVWQWVRRLFGPRTRRRLAVTAVALVGGWFGLLVGGSVTAPVGPVETHLSLRPSITGNTFVDVAPLGTLELDTTDAPLAIHASVAEIRVEAAREIFDDPRSLNGLQDRIVDDLQKALVRLALQSLGFGVLGAAAFTAAVFRTWRRVLKGSLVTLGLMLITYAAAAATWNQQAVEQPRYTGLLASAPSLVGSAESIASDFGRYRIQLAKLVTNVSKLYDATSALPTYEPDPNTIRVLHVSDIHLNPAAWNVIASVKEQFGASMIIDTGDITDHGSTAEGQFVDEIEKLDVPYVYVKGNHDSEATVQAVERQDNAIVLSGRSRTVDGIRLWGIGDPRFTPDKSVHADEDAVPLEAYGQQLRPRIEAAGTIDIALTHDPTVTKEWQGIVPLTLAGHTHRRETRLTPGGTREMTVGSTGGAGLRALDHEEPTPIELNVLYFDKRTKRLQAWDEITLGGLGLTSAQIDRHIEEKPNRPLNPIAGESPTPVPTPTPSGSKTPFTVPPTTPPTAGSTTGGRRRPGRRSPPP